MTFDPFTSPRNPYFPPMARKDRLLAGIEEIMKSGISGELRAIARREYLDRTNPAHENDNRRVA